MKIVHISLILVILTLSSCSKKDENISGIKNISQEKIEITSHQNENPAESGEGSPNENESGTKIRGAEMSEKVEVNPFGGQDVKHTSTAIQTATFGNIAPNPQ